ncbi:hypothetical protein CHUAL_010675 [Chamberlinius hualienensis]
MKYLVIICFIVLVLIGFSFQSEIPFKRDGLNKRDHNSVDVSSLKRRGLFSNIVGALINVPKTLFGDPSTKSSPSSETVDISANINIQEKVNFLTTTAKTAASIVQVATPNLTSPRINVTTANVTSATASLNTIAFNSVITTPRTTSFSLTSTTIGITTGSTKGSSSTLASSSTTTQFNNKIINNTNQINDTISTANIKDPTTTTSTKSSTITVITKDTFTTATTKDPTTFQTPLNLANILNIGNLLNSIVSTTTDTILKTSTAGSSSSLTSSTATTKPASTSSSTFINDINMLNANQNPITADAVKITMSESSTSSSTIAAKSTATASNSENTIVSNGSRFDNNSIIGDSIGSLLGVSTTTIASSTATTTTVTPTATSSVAFKDPIAFTSPIPTTTSANITSGESKIDSTQPSTTTAAFTTRTTSISTKAAPMTTTLRNDNANSGVIFGGLNNFIENVDSVFNPTSTRAISLAEATTASTSLATSTTTTTTTTPEIPSNRNSNANGDGLIGGFVNNFFNGINSILNPTSTVSTKSILSDSVTETISTATTSSSNPNTTTPSVTETTSSLNSNPNDGFFNDVFKGIDSIMNPASTVSTKSISLPSLTETIFTSTTFLATPTPTTPIVTETTSSLNSNPIGDVLIGGLLNNVFNGIDSILNPASTVSTKSISPASLMEPIYTATTSSATPTPTTPIVTETTSSLNSNPNGDGIFNNVFKGIDSVLNPTSTVSTKSISPPSSIEPISTATTSSVTSTPTTPIVTETTSSVNSDPIDDGLIGGIFKGIDSILNPAPTVSTKSISSIEPISTATTSLATPNSTTLIVTETTSSLDSNPYGDRLIGGLFNNVFNDIDSILNPASTVPTKSISPASLMEPIYTATTSSAALTTPIVTETTSSFNSDPSDDGLIGGIFKGIDSIMNPAPTVSTKSNSLTETISTSTTSLATPTLTTPIVPETTSSLDYNPIDDGLIGGIFKGIDSILNPASTESTKSIWSDSFIESTSTPITTSAATTESTISTTNPPFDLSSILQNQPFVGTLFVSQPPNSVATDPPTTTIPIPTVSSVSPNQNNDFFNIPFLGPIAKFVDNLNTNETTTVKNVPTTTLAPTTPSPFNFFDNIFAAFQPPIQTTPSPTSPPESELCKTVGSIPFFNLIIPCSAPTNWEHPTQAPTNPISAMVKNIPIIGDVLKTIFPQSNNDATPAPLFDIWTIMEFLPGIGPVVKFIRSLVTGEIIFQIPIIGPIIKGIVQSCAD